MRCYVFFFFSSRRRHTRSLRDWSSDVCSSDLELAGRDLGADLAALIADAYDELSSRCFEINVPTAVRSSAIGEDSGTASFAGIFDTYLGVSGQDRVLDAVRACWASLFNARAVAS